MEQRTLGRTGLEVGFIGLGTEYLINRPRETMAAVLQRAVDAGVNYVDLLYNHAAFLKDFGPAMAPLRERMVLCVHWGVGERDGQMANIRDQAECEHSLDGALAAMDTDYADVGMLMMIDDQALYDAWVPPSLETLHRLRDAGRVRHIGMSSHKADIALHAVRSGAIDVLMFPVNLASHSVAGNHELEEACLAHGVGLVAMKPYAGGALLEPQSSVFLHWVRSGGQALQIDKAAGITPTQCLSYLATQPAVSTVVPGVKSVAELEGALHYLDATPAERAHGDLVATIERYPVGQCIYCNHCLPCPAHIDIGAVIRLVDQANAGVPLDALRDQYAARDATASDCIQCGACLDRCPYQVQVIDKMEEAVRLFG